MRAALGVILGLSGLLLSTRAARCANVLSNDWSVALYDHSDTTPAVASDGTICFGTWKGELWALKPDGSRKWIFRAGSEIKASPAVGLDGTIYFGSRDRKLYAVRADGTKRWEFRTGGWVDSSPALARDGTVYFGSWDKGFYALNVDGTKQWQFKTGGPIVSSPAIGAGGTIYFGSHDKKLYALAPDGHEKWAFATGGPILSSPALNSDQCLYITSVDGFLYALNLDGSLRWRLRTGGITESSPVIGPDGTIYVGAFGQPWAITADGKKKWGLTSDDEFYPFEASMTVLADGMILCVFHNGLVCYMSPDADPRWMYYLASYGYGSPAIGPTGAIYLPDCAVANAPGGGFSALRAGVSLAHTSWPKFRCNARNTGNLQDVAP
jgi:outer membrane protein assembly factor BamB